MHAYVFTYRQTPSSWTMCKKFLAFSDPEVICISWTYLKICDYSIADWLIA